MTQYDISVIVPVYNAEGYLRQCVDSILAQTKKNIELVLVDDGSTDNCPAMIDEYAGRFVNVCAVHQANTGLAGARVAGLNNASGKYIGFVDADDFIEPAMYEELYDLLQAEKADYVYCDYDFWPGKVAAKEKWFKPFTGIIDWHYLERNNQSWNTLTSRELLDEIQITKLYPLFGEYSFIAVLLHSKKTASLERVLYHYRVGHDSLSGGSYRGKVPKFRRGVEMTFELNRLIDGTKYEETLSEYFAYRIIYTLLQLAVVSSINSDRDNYEFARTELRKRHPQTNPLTREILDFNHGRLKSFVLRRLIPANYCLARLITSIVYRN